MDYKESIKQRLNLLPPALKSFILDENWRREAEKIGKQFNFSEENYAYFENEIFLVLLSFEPREDFMENIRTELKIDLNLAGWISEDVNKKIFDKVSEEIDSTWEVPRPQQSDLASTPAPAENSKTSAPENIGINTAEQTQKTNEVQGSIGDSFEKIILNQAKAMAPARGEGEAAKAGEGAAKPAIHHELPQDPYREPIG